MIRNPRPLYRYRVTSAVSSPAPCPEAGTCRLPRPHQPASAHAFAPHSGQRSVPAGRGYAHLPHNPARSRRALRHRTSRTTPVQMPTPQHAANGIAVIVRRSVQPLTVRKSTSCLNAHQPAQSITHACIMCNRDVQISDLDTVAANACSVPHKRWAHNNGGWRLSWQQRMA